MQNRPKIIVICGPTGIGKTSTAIRLCRQFAGEIISADSLQVYREMNIGTAKPTPEEQALVPHHLIDVVRPDQPFDAAAFEREADQTIVQLTAQGKQPFVVGGTGLYIKALIHGLSRARAADPVVLKRLQEEGEQIGSQALHDRLRQCDPVTAGRVHPNDLFRIIRGLEIFEITGKPLSRFQEDHRFADNKYQALKICLSADRDVIYNRINQRVDLMLEQGLLQETRQLLDKGYVPDLKPLQSLGYRHMVEFLTGRQSWEEAVETMKRDTRRYAKRQLTWFRSDPEMHWFSKDETAVIQELIQTHLGQPFCS